MCSLRQCCHRSIGPTTKYKNSNNNYFQMEIKRCSTVSSAYIVWKWIMQFIVAIRKCKTKLYVCALRIDQVNFTRVFFSLEQPFNNNMHSSTFNEKFLSHSTQKLFSSNSNIKLRKRNTSFTICYLMKINCFKTRVSPTNKTDYYQTPHSNLMDFIKLFSIEIIFFGFCNTLCPAPGRFDFIKWFLWN